MNLAATKFEFEQRFWIIWAIFGVGFGLYNVDHVNVAQSIVADTFLLQLTFGCGALLVFLFDTSTRSDSSTTCVSVLRSPGSRVGNVSTCAWVH